MNKGTRETVRCSTLASLTGKTFQVLHYVIDSDTFPAALLPAAEPAQCNNQCIEQQLSTAHEMFLFTTITD